MLACEASLTLALGFRDLKPAVVGTCALPGTGLDGRYERLLHELRTNWTDVLGKQALQAVSVLKQRVDTLEAGLSRDLPQFASVIRPATVEDIRSRLQPDELLVEFVAYPGPGRRYGAFVLGRTGELLWVDLGPANSMDRAAQDLIAAANDWSASLARKETRGAESASETARDALGRLSKQLSPLIAQWIQKKKDISRLRIAPDGMLNLVPFAALSDAAAISWWRGSPSAMFRPDATLPLLLNQATLAAR